ncbi:MULTISPECIES: toxin-antitoxin system YwqK family antitoxin [unclassified Olleya]|jgi:antitoxin component YwqK of YwqJK toxin-antitoxin module|uniref:toxin-antitoxin system YwqK family antitoxin n=1 Tax=unclassified Olleya TaxID=2615019 RepID=UPI00119CB35A|nr:toxin-antitoxin system YwqK family antitoxin [Olleya sp. Hel_I_94]TVZ49714.1 antitoxin component YwqK of YwqJK toxin-antitoxin module [Olleya sp. Hel_I_94]
MKKTSFLLFCLFVTSLVMAQSLNQFDANAQRHGTWKKNFDNTKVVRYEGQFDHGKEVGTFKFYKNIDNKAVLTATKVFNADNDVALVTFYSSNGKKISEGKMRGHDYIGKWVIYHKNVDQVMTQELYNDKGKLEGERLVFYLNGQIAEKAYYMDGLLHGESKWYAENGTIMKLITYNANKFEGPYKTYTKDGVIAVEGYYKDDVKCCVWKRYKDGKLVEEKDLDKKAKK